MATPQTLANAGRPVAAKTASSLIVTGNGCFQRLIVSTSSSLVLSAYDALTATGTKLISSYPVTAGSVHTFDMIFNTGLFIEVVSGSGEFTAIVSP